MATDDDLNDVFKVLDPDNKGKIPAAQLAFALRALEKNPTAKEVAEMLEKYKNGCSLSEFKALYKSKASGRHPVEQDKEMREVLAVLDKDGAGSINVVELRQILMNLGDAVDSKTIDAVFKEIKVDVDGMVSYEDFVDMLVNDYPLHMTGKVKFGGR
mmetsp:Transcript_28675/g.69730  ORF Transcript_28675/g.69730 Transcript_28675/m.69730 type:complete len:157 (+) Transcript_28675:94-564(+)|eukprot:CAMPEP_0198309810 /NCGR_PEP_ID=MMETSP1450-20131203/2076_1 /TAXON_ID=753684 ORGANISM="Madagascaria erythrocladiodes, Strain CCMP3234" /NCGR_SAMPLE_ID=MMETSP1450 /ASSEMBLY_ACC=CAM_ASM_001115 /LENGTH=156 /DNA_ID=CAMNT_0044012589 /DNA_START=79 /DNA_END=549 /DNA_ORIENTATION=-